MLVVAAVDKACTKNTIHYDNCITNEDELYDEDDHRKHMKSQLQGLETTALHGKSTIYLRLFARCRASVFPSNKETDI